MKAFLLSITLLFTSLFANGQAGSTAIGAISPDPSARLDISSTSQGLLVPRMTATQRTAISAPAKGLMVYDSTNNSFYYYNGSSWGVVGDNLGNHTATQNLSLGNQFGSSYQLVGGGSNHGLSIASDGHVEIGSLAAFTGGSTSLQVDSGFTIKQISVPVTTYTNYSTVTIPDNVSQVAITGTSPGPVTIFAYPLTAGQQLTIWNHTSGGWGADVYGGGSNVISTIPNGQMMTFRSVGSPSASYLPEASSNNNVRNVSCNLTTVNMLGSDYFLNFNPCVSGQTYNLSDPTANSGRSVYIVNRSSVNSVSLISPYPPNLGGILDVGSSFSTSSSITLPVKGRAMLISNGNDWIRMY